MRVTTWGEYGMLVAVHLARRAGEGPVPARTLAAQERLPPDYVEQILLRMRRAGIVASVRGARGGYALARRPAEITVREVLQAAEKVTFEVNCTCHPVHAVRCDPGANCTIRSVWQLLEQRINEFLDGITLGDLLQDEAHVFQVAGTGTPR